ncbi:hypothetical protein KIN20_004308 [Parelaphostrongylus tenuis]|uniref:Moesin/ezrin/radixin homolog 1 n=1 Tax=Parelaphostrongylus tenuis TaxID=148309 RepID=A0AAD5MJL0_PARTN|nr:hypothetical protein KIN20_004308 [Parelaphostrongylus tenuis]
MQDTDRESSCLHSRRRSVRVFFREKNALGSEVYDQVFYSLDLEEKDYFGLQFTDHYHVHHWLDPMKKLAKQVPIGPPYTFRFRVKFYTSEPSNLKEELTRYQFFLQIKQDILSGRLPCSKEAGVELAAYALQSELGDYNPNEHDALFISQFRFHPEQDAQMEIDILERFKLCRGQTPAQAEANYLSRAKWLELYGVDMHTVEGKDGNQYSLGLTPSGMLVFDGSEKIGLFFWEKIQKLDFKNRKITLVVEEDVDQSTTGQVQLHTFVFNLASHKACKHLWKCAIEHHTFFRLKTRPCVKHPRRQLFRLGSTFNGRTEYEAVHKDVARLSRRATSTFERRPSQRFGPRQSHALVNVSSEPEPLNSSTPSERLVSHLSVRKETETPLVTAIPSAPTPVVSNTTVDPVHPHETKPTSCLSNGFSSENSSLPVQNPSAPSVPSNPSSSQHITTIPIVEENASPPVEKSVEFSPPVEAVSVRFTSRIPKYSPNSSCKEHGDETDVKSVPTNPIAFTSSTQAEQDGDVENVSPPSSTSPTNTNLKANTGIPRPSKIRPPTTRFKAEPNNVQVDCRMSRIPQVSEGWRPTNGSCALSGQSRIPMKSGFDKASRSRLITDL